MPAPAKRKKSATPEKGEPITPDAIESTTAPIVGAPVPDLMPLAEKMRRHPEFAAFAEKARQERLAAEEAARIPLAAMLGGYEDPISARGETGAILTFYPRSPRLERLQQIFHCVTQDADKLTIPQVAERLVEIATHFLFVNTGETHDDGFPKMRRATPEEIGDAFSDQELIPIVEKYTGFNFSGPGPHQKNSDRPEEATGQSS